MNEASEEKRRQRYQRYRVKHVEKRKQYMTIYREQNAEKIRQQRKEYNAKNAEKIKQYSKEYYAKNAEKIQIYNRSQAGKEVRRDYKRRMRVLPGGKLRWPENPERRRINRNRWKAANPEKRKASYRRDYERNKDRFFAHSALRRARKALVSVFLTSEEKSGIRDLYKQRDLISRTTGIEYHVDHVIPIGRGGLHHPTNLQLLPAVENWKKNAR